MRQRMQTMAWAVALMMGAALVAAGPASAWSQAKSKQKQQPKQQDQQAQPDQQDQKADQQQPPQTPPGGGLLKKSVTASSSKQGKETASAGFNGVGPDGKVKEALLNANPSATAKQKAAQLSLLEADAADVQAFAKEGKLNLPAKGDTKKGK